MVASKSGIWANPRHGTSTGYGTYRCRCVECRAWNAEQGRKRRARNPESGRSYARNYYKDRPSMRRGQTFKRYGLTPEQYAALLEKQLGICAICGARPTREKPLQIDHDHACCPQQKSCGRCVRGLLCKRCNTGIALLQDDPQILKLAFDYLTKQGKTMNPNESALNAMHADDVAQATASASDAVSDSHAAAFNFAREYTPEAVRNVAD